MAGKIQHQSDCEVHNEPAYPKGYCSCGADKVGHLKWWIASAIGDFNEDLENHPSKKEELTHFLIDDISKICLEHDINK